MKLSAEQKELLEARYETWGFDRVREELEREDRDLIAHPEGPARARAWIESKEARQRRADRSIVIILIAGIIQLGVALVLALKF
jgi:hypothetical protein